MERITLQPIGIIHTPFTSIENMPIQPQAAPGIEGHIDLFPRYTDGLGDLDGFSHITLLFYLHKVSTTALRVTPFMDTVERGVFATRAPVRPNHIGLSTVRLNSINGGRVVISEVDILDGSPLLDIKPFYSRFDNRTDTVCGWLDNHTATEIAQIQSDNRFASDPPHQER
jgi:tRNA-Thr(GGU) m(6)t(6)A37 methyltransferase TsaA